tara:strand:+ start:624 stop:1055 length:432 start_codon:yes stop_codon:yes gene_type:complete
MGERFKDINMSNRLTAEDLVEVSLGHEEDFLKVKETLTRMGVSSRKEKKLYQSCHILHKKGKYYIVHFKELFGLDGLPNNISDGDIARRNMIISLLEEWELIKIVDINKCEEPMASLGQIKIIPHRDKDEWELIPKYHIGNKR